ncbi:serine hydrolase domain-containing protein [Goodfellowiella coeruleoviolacea]|uniref:D-alanyl-D-alanine carboxypeptidase n=1 Tax=Goodfellowiella coeruleoviolacea TaxID=334858 RepID=A0AAE3GD73_9PSEU|nr:serine hydrolase domain-containing protein [Goodfellowiella coeruleoviolacea]MCP2165940.1 D-alanyl-D-alanine carboxypeptidase [Goodfellowiella coeruleoviolacea]
MPTKTLRTGLVAAALTVVTALAVSTGTAAALAAPGGTAAGLAATGGTAAAASALPVAGLQAGIADLVATGSASAALARVQDGPARWSGAAGVRDLASGRSADPAGYFRIGSVTKTFVATVVLQLVDERRLALDDPIDRHLPGVVPDGQHITVRQILNHTSGLYDYAHEAGYSTNRWRGAERFRTYQPRELLDVAFAHEPYFAPGAGWHYSNTNYIVAGLLIERLTGHGYGEEIARRVLRPLRLTQTSVPGTNPRLPEPHTHGYVEVAGQGWVDATEMNPSLDWAAGEMISTTADLNRFFAALLGGRLTSPASLAAMKDTVETGTMFRYGLGLQRFDLPCGTSVYGHGGELLGYLTYATRADSGRQFTLTYNPYQGKPSNDSLISLFVTAYCPA